MKKYKLKEEVRKLVKVPNGHAVNDLDYWLRYVTLEALEEVPSRIKLLVENSYNGNMNTKLIKHDDTSPFTPQQRVICEKALNGELLDIDSIHNQVFNEWHEEEKGFSFWENQNYDIKGLKRLLKAYLKQKNDI